MIVAALRKLGFANFHSGKALAEMMSGGVLLADVDWLVLCTDEYHLPQALADITQVYSEKGNYRCEISLLYEAIPTGVLPQLFALGILSCHAVDFGKDGLGHLLNQFTKTGKACGWDRVAIAAHYLREVLKGLGDNQEVLAFERSLEAVFRDVKSPGFHLAQAYYQLGRLPEALRALDRGVFFNPNLKDEAKRWEQVFLHDHLDGSRSFADRFAVGRVLLAVNDPEYAKIVAEVLVKMGVKTIRETTAGAAALELVRAEDFDLLITGMAFSDAMAGEVFIQRCRAYSPFTPMVLVADPLSERQGQLAKDLRIMAVINKPARPKQVLMGLAWSITQSLRPTEPKTLERRVVSRLLQGAYHEAMNLYKIFANHSATSAARRGYADGLFAMAKGNSERALALLEKAYSDSQGCHGDIIMLLARVCLSQGRQEQGLRLLKEAVAQSPANVARLCRLAAVLLDLRGPEVAKPWLAKAQAIDPDHPQVVELAAKYCYAAGDQEGGAALLAQADHKEPILRFLNNTAAAMIAKNRYRDSAALVRRVLAETAPEQAFLGQVLRYNLALSLAYGGESDKACELLDSLLPQVQGALKHLVARLRTALEVGTCSGEGYVLEDLGEFGQIADDPDDRQTDDSPGLRGVYRLSPQQRQDVDALVRRCKPSWAG